MRIMTPSEALKNAYLNIETVLYQIPRTGWNNYEDEGVTIYFYNIDVTNLNIKDGHDKTIIEFIAGGDEVVNSLQLLRDGFIIGQCINNSFSLYSLKDPGSIVSSYPDIIIKLTIFRQSDL